MSKFDFTSLDNKNINEVINVADNLSKQNLEDKLNAYKIYQSIIQINQIPNIYQFPNTYLRGSVHQKIYELEKLLNLNEHFFSQAGQDKFINNSYFQ